MDKQSLKQVLESLIFASDSAITLNGLCGILEGVERQAVKEALTELVSEHRERGGGIFIEEVAGGYQFRTDPEHSAWIKRLFKVGGQRISRAAMESLAIIAYRQPVTRGELEAIRGVDSAGVLSTLMDKRLIKITGRVEAPGRPVVYGTTKEFLEAFDLIDLSCLPPLKDIQTLEDEDAAQEASEDKITEALVEAPDGEVDLEDETRGQARDEEGEAGEAGGGEEGADTTGDTAQGGREDEPGDASNDEAEDKPQESSAQGPSREGTEGAGEPEGGEAPESDSERGGNVPA